MKSSDSTGPDSCPACGSTNIDTAFDFASGRCLECNFVIDDETDGEVPSTEITDTLSSAPEPNQDWKQMVELQDSSDEKLVQLVEQSETIAETVLVAKEQQLQTVELVMEAWTSGVTHGRRIDLVAAASVEIACRQAGRPRPRAVIADAASVDSTTLKSTSKTLLDAIDKTRCSNLPRQYLYYIREEMGCSMEAKTSAEQVLDTIKKRPPGNPAGTAAAAMYLGMKDKGEDVTLREVADTVALTKETVWSRVDDLRRSDVY